MRFLTLLHLATTARAVSLASFTPRIDFLPAQCDAAYRKRISDCTGDDFAQPGKVACSTACVSSLETIGELVKKECNGVDVAETSIVGLFLVGLGVQALCPTAPLQQSITSSAKTVGATSTSVPSSLRTMHTTTTTSALAEESAEATSSSTSSSSTGLGTDTDPGMTTTRTTSTRLAPTSSAVPATETTSGQLSNTNSGGGSPFDVVAAGASSRLHIIDEAAAALLAAALLFVVCS